MPSDLRTAIGPENHQETRVLKLSSTSSPDEARKLGSWSLSGPNGPRHLDQVHDGRHAFARDPVRRWGRSTWLGGCLNLWLCISLHPSTLIPEIGWTWSHWVGNHSNHTGPIPCFWWFLATSRHLSSFQIGFLILQSLGNLEVSKYSVIMLDEAHERTPDICIQTGTIQRTASW